MKNTIVFLVTFLGAIIFAGCTKCGCTDPDAINYRRAAQEDDGSCVYFSARPLAGKYKCTRRSIYYRQYSTDTAYTNVTIEIYPVRTCERLMRVCDTSLGLSFYIACYNNGIIRDTVIPGVPGYAPGIDNVKYEVKGSYGAASICIRYFWNNRKKHDYTGIRTQKFQDGYETPDYRDIWAGTYRGTKITTSWWNWEDEDNYSSGSNVSDPEDVLLEVSLTDNDSVIKINEIGDNPDLNNAMYYVKANGSLKSVVGLYGRRSYFSGDSLFVSVGDYGLGAGYETSYYCKKK